MEWKVLDGNRNLVSGAKGIETDNSCYVTIDGLNTEGYFEIIAKADSSNGGWPVMELWIDNEVRSLAVDNSSPASYFFTITDILAGQHCVKIDYKNGSWASGRKLYIDKLIIHTTDGSLLKPDINEPLSDQKTVVDIPKKFPSWVI